MKKTSIIIGIVMSCVVTLNLNAQNGIFRVKDKKTQIAYSSNTYSGEYLTLGKGTASPYNGTFGIEYWNGGLNIWKPWNTWDYGNYKMFIDDGGYVGINMRPMSWYTQSTGWWWWKSTIRNFRLQIEGNAVSHGWYTWSDLSIKSNIEPIPSSLSKILALEPKMYNYKKEGINKNIPTSDSDEVKNLTIQNENSKPIPTEDEPKHYGLIAQEVKEQFPNIVGKVGDSIEAVNYVELIPILIKAIQEQQETISDLIQEVENWKGKSIDSNESNTRLFQNTPNPFDGMTTISYFIDENTSISNAQIEIRDIMGGLKNTIDLGDRSGIGSIDYDGNSLNMGYHIYTLKINGSIKDSKMFLKE